MKTATQLRMGKDSTQVNLPLFVGLGGLAWLIGVLFIRFAGTMFFVKGSLWLVGLSGNWVKTSPFTGTF